MVLEGPHEGFFVLLVVVVAEDVEDAVDYEEGGFPLDEVTGVGGLSEGLGEADYHVAEVWEFVGWCGEGGVVPESPLR